jgi:hypothetical protein
MQNSNPKRVNGGEVAPQIRSQHPRRQPSAD